MRQTWENLWLAHNITKSKPSTRTIKKLSPYWSRDSIPSNINTKRSKIRVQFNSENMVSWKKILLLAILVAALEAGEFILMRIEYLFYSNEPLLQWPANHSALRRKLAWLAEPIKSKWICTLMAQTQRNSLQSLAFRAAPMQCSANSRI